MNGGKKISNFGIMCQILVDSKRQIFELIQIMKKGATSFLSVYIFNFERLRFILYQLKFLIM